MFTYPFTLFKSLGELWTPAEITTWSWHDSSDASTVKEDDVAGRCSQLDDKSGNSRHLTQTVLAEQPFTGTRTVNGLNVLDLDHNNDHHMVAFSYPTPVNFEISFFNMSVIDSSNSTVNSLFSLDNVSAGGDFQIDAGSTASDFDMRLNQTGLGGGDINPPDIPDGYQDLTLTNAEFKTNGTARYKIRVDGTDLGDTVFLAALALETDLAIGADRIRTTFMDMAFNEMVVVESAITPDTEELIEGYLAHKWGNTAKLPALHPYKNNPPRV